MEKDQKPEKTYSRPFPSSERPGFLPDYPPGVGLEKLDALAPNDPARDDVCKRMCLEDRIALMARYGRDLHGQPVKGKA